MTIEQLKHIQIEKGMLARHIVWVGEQGYAIAHEQAERDAVDRGALFSLFDCDIHKWLEEQDEAPVPEGIYAVDEIYPWLNGVSGDWYFRPPYWFEKLCKRVENE